MGQRRRHDPVLKHELDPAEKAAVRSMRDVLGYEAGHVNPRLGLGDMTDPEISKVAQAAVSGWIVQRSRDLVGDRIFDEHEFLATGEVPEPMELGPCSFALPALGEWLEKQGLADVAMQNWRKADILLFVWTAWDLVQRAHTIRDERPGPSPLASDLNVSGPC